MLRGNLDPSGLPRVPIVIRGPFGTRRYDAIVDTGFDGTLALPGDEIQRLGLLRHGVRYMRSSNNQVGPTRTYWCEADWFNGWVGFEVLQAGVPEALVGAGLLRGHELVVDYGPSWSVEIR